MSQHALRTQIREMKKELGETELPVGIRAKVRRVDSFDARGMKHVYGRGDSWGRHASFNMDVWLRRDGLFMVRFWSRCREIEGNSIGVQSVPSRLRTAQSMDESWVPDALRVEYAEWIVREM